MRQTMFIPNHTLAVFFGMTKFDINYRKTRKGEYVPFFDDLPEAKRDCEDLKKCLNNYNFKEENCYDLSNNPTLKQIEAVWQKIRARLKEGKNQQPKVNYTIIFLFAGHGMLMEGNQVLVLNEWDKDQGFYRLFQAEKRLRMLADSYENCYVIGIFACCR